MTGKRILKIKEYQISLFILVLVIMLSHLFLYITGDKVFEYMLPYNQNLSFFGNQAGQLTAYILLPFLSSWIVHSFYSVHYSGRMDNAVVIREVQRSNVFWRRLITCFVSGIFLMLVTCLLDLILSMILYPWKSVENFLFNIGYYITSFYSEFHVFDFDSVFLNKPILMILCYYLSYCIYGGLLFSASLLVCKMRVKNRALSIFAVPLAVIVITMALSVTGLYRFSILWMFDMALTDRWFFPFLMILDIIMITAAVLMNFIWDRSHRDEI